MVRVNVDAWPRVFVALDSWPRMEHALARGVVIPAAASELALDPDELERLLALARAEPAAEVDLGRRVAELRAELGWSLRKLARQSGVSRSMVARIESGEVDPLRSVRALASALGLPIAELLAAELGPAIDARPRVAIELDSWERMRAAMLLAAVQGAPVDLAPAVLGMHPGELRSALARARRLLAE